MKARHKQNQSQAQRARKAKKGKPGSLVETRVFAPLLGVWGALLGGLPIMVLPPAMIAGATEGTGLAALNVPVQPVLAGLAALVLGPALYLTAAAFSKRARRRANTPSVAEFAVRSVLPIDPVRDLGTRSLDDPLADMPFATPAWRDADLEVSQTAPVADAPEALDKAPRELDLAEFAVMPGRNAVWVEDAPVAEAAPEPQPAPAPVASAPAPGLRSVQAPPDPGTAALSRLRAVPANQLSLPQMVERFAGALHEHRASAPARALTAAEIAAREAALAEALKALAALSGDQAQASASEPLRDALAQFRDARTGMRTGVRGAA
jgi:hypothetical protein